MGLKKFDYQEIPPRSITWFAPSGVGIASTSGGGDTHALLNRFAISLADRKLGEQTEEGA